MQSIPLRKTTFITAPLKEPSRGGIMDYFLPGPMRCSEQALKELSKPVFSHRSPEFKELLVETAQQLQEILHTDGKVVPVCGTGTCGVEFMICNLIAPNDRVLCLVNGHFSKRAHLQAKIYSKHVDVIEAAWGDTFDMNTVESALKKEKYSAVVVVSNETSTGAWTDVKTLAEICSHYDAMLLVDHVSGVGNPYYMDPWNIDATVTTTHESFSAPPGLTIIAFSEEAIKRAEQTPQRNLYLHLPTYLKYLEEEREPPFTLPTTLLAALHANLEEILKEGLENFYQRHREMATTLRRGLKELGFKIFTKPRAYSNTLTAIYSPIKARELTALLRKHYNTYIAPGKGEYIDTVLRIGHAGTAITIEDIQKLLKTLKQLKEEHLTSTPKTTFTARAEASSNEN